MKNGINRFEMAIVALGLIFGMVGSTWAGTIISNLPGNDGSFGNLGPTSTVGDGFTITGGQNLALDDVMLRLDLLSGSSPVATLWSGAANPTVQLTTLVNPVFNFGVIQTYTFTPASPVTLLSGTTYWAVLTNTSSSTGPIRWYQNSPSVTPTGSSAVFAGTRTGTPGPPTTPDEAIHSFAVDATAQVSAVPEPTSLVIAATGVLAGLGCAWRRRQTVRA